LEKNSNLRTHGGEFGKSLEGGVKKRFCFCFMGALVGGKKNNEYDC